MGLLGAIIGDISGSQYEYDRTNNPDGCELFSEKCMFTDDTVMSLAIKYAIDNNIDYESAMRKIGSYYPDCGYGGNFWIWMFCQNPKPYNSFGNGSAMRVSYIGEYFDDINDVIKEAEKSALPSHNHNEGIKGAITTAVCVWMAKHKFSKKDIYDYVLKQYPSDKYRWNVTISLDELIKNYSWDITCMTSVPIAVRCFYESSSYISFLRNVYSLDCDADTIAAIGGGIAEEFYGETGLKNEYILNHYLDERLLDIYGKCKNI